MSGFWLPTDRLSSRPINDIEPGRLVILPPSSDAAATMKLGMEGVCPIGIRFAHADRLPVFALTPFYGGACPAGDAVDLALETRPFLTLDAKLTFEADATAPAKRGTNHEFKPGELIVCRAGLAIAAFFNRTVQAHKFVRPIGLADWTMLPNEDSSSIIFGGWRLRVEIPDLDPFYWAPWSASALDANVDTSTLPTQVLTHARQYRVDR